MSDKRIRSTEDSLLLNILRDQPAPESMKASRDETLRAFSALPEGVQAAVEKAALRIAFMEEFDALQQFSDGQINAESTKNDKFAAMLFPAVSLEEGFYNAKADPRDFSTKNAQHPLFSVYIRATEKLGDLTEIAKHKLQTDKADDVANSIMRTTDALVAERTPMTKIQKDIIEDVLRDVGQEVTVGNISRFDLKKDGVLDRDELKALDRDGDGSITMQDVGVTVATGIRVSERDVAMLHSIASERTNTHPGVTEIDLCKLPLQTVKDKTRWGEPEVDVKGVRFRE